MVEPIRTLQDIQKIKKMLKKEKKYRDLLMFTLGLNFALRGGDLLRLKVSDLYDEEMNPKPRIRLREKKTGKENVIGIMNGAKDALLEFRKQSNLEYSDNFIFKSRKGMGHITRLHMCRIIKDACAKVGMDDINVGSHTLRKSWGYHAYTKFDMSLDSIMLKLNHQSITSTKRYIGLSQFEKEQIESVVSF